MSLTVHALVADALSHDLRTDGECGCRPCLFENEEDVLIVHRRETGEPVIDPDMLKATALADATEGRADVVFVTVDEDFTILFCPGPCLVALVRSGRLWN